MYKETINIAFSASEQYLQYVPVVIYSLCKNNIGNNLNFHIFHSLDKKIKFVEFRYKKIFKDFNNAKFNFYHLNKSIYSNLPLKKGWSVELWGRWKVLDILAGEEDRVLILGVDTLIKKDIYKFYSQDLSGIFFAACPDTFISNSKGKDWKGNEYLRKYNVAPEGYINADVVLVNLSETYGKISFSDFLSSYFKINSSCLDQDVINFCYRDKLKLCDDFKYNFFPNTPFFTKYQNLKFYNEASIIQFTGSVNKPWNIFKHNWGNFIGVKEWWILAEEIGITYHSLLFDKFTRKIMRFFKKIKAYIKSLFI